MNVHEYDFDIEDEDEHQSRIYLVAFDDIQLGTERRYLVNGVIPRTGLVVVWGPPKSGKSFIVFDLVMHVALGRPYRGRGVHPGTAVYCAFEGITGIQARCAAFARNSWPIIKSRPFLPGTGDDRFGEGRTRTNTSHLSLAWRCKAGRHRTRYSEPKLTRLGVE